ncbi:Uu.00g018500.m01.CDS01 [Anthostomella pinea]|uniref:Uu.00g018500.m01.CDS01 n=1 Tax=Anthostomella pinea TaxID=933095 RepID=A0AAI8YQR1_9PEZI|nr:Uu.00g018500.m01.CDS01 [Anthostomella pinea]
MATYTNHCLYQVYKLCEREFASWLARTTAKHGQGTPSPDGSEPIPLDHWPRLARSIVQNKDNIPSEAIHNLNSLIEYRERIVLDNFPFLSRTALLTLRSVRSILMDEPEASEPEASEPEASEPEASDEALFSWLCFFIDIYSVRHSISCIWSQYKNQKTSLINASLVTNTAIQIVKGMCQVHLEDTKDLPGAPDTKYHGTWVFDIVNIRSGKLPLIVSEEECTTAEWCCHEAYFHLRGASEGYASNDLWHASHSLPKTSSTSVKTDLKKPGPERLKNDGVWAACMLGHLHNFTSVSSRGSEDILGPYLDDITFGWRDWVLVDSKKSKSRKRQKRTADETFPELEDDIPNIPLWLIISFQILLDIRHELQEDLQKGFNQLKEFSKIMIRDIRKRPLNDDSFDIIRFVGKCVDKDAFSKLLRETSNQGVAGGNREPEHYLLKNHPLLCGMQAFWMQQKWRSAVAQIIDRSWLIPAMYLYMGLRLEGLVDVWDDMEHVINVQGAMFIRNLSAATPDAGLRLTTLDQVCDALSSNMVRVMGPSSIQGIYLMFEDGNCELKSGWPYALSTLALIRTAASAGLKSDHYHEKLLQKGLNPREVLLLVGDALEQEEIAAHIDWNRLQARCQKWLEPLHTFYDQQFHMLLNKTDQYKASIRPPGVTRQLLTLVHANACPLSSEKGNRLAYNLLGRTVYDDFDADTRSTWLWLANEIGFSLPTAAEYLRPIIEGEGFAEVKEASRKFREMNLFDQEEELQL